MRWKRKQRIKRKISKALAKTMSAVLILIVFVVQQAQLLRAFESHVINVTAKICDYSETRSLDYWKNHPEVFRPFLPQTLGNDNITGVIAALAIFSDANSSNAREALMAQLLAMKFNIIMFGIGGYAVEGENKTLDQFTAYADDLLKDPNSSSLEIARVKDILDDINNLHQLRYCSAGGSGGPENDHVVINEVYYDPDNRLDCHTQEQNPANEWVEIYNPTDEPVNISGWTLRDNNSTSTIPASPSIPAYGFAVISSTSTTWNFWQIPPEAIKISLNHNIGNGLSDTGDHLILKDSQGNEVDAMSYESDHFVWNPAPPLDSNGNPYGLPDGHSLGRLPDGFDTDSAEDFEDITLPTPGAGLSNPKVKVNVPNGGEVWYFTKTYHIKWLATNPLGNDSDLKIDIWYSVDSGQSWIYQIASSTANTGDYAWTIPYKTDLASSKSRIKVIARNLDNLIGWDMSDCDFCPPLDDEEELIDPVDFIVEPIATSTEQIMSAEVPAGSIEQKISLGSEMLSESTISPQPSPAPEASPTPTPTPAPEAQTDASPSPTPSTTSEIVNDPAISPSLSESPSESQPAEESVAFASGTKSAVTETPSVPSGQAPEVVPTPPASPSPEQDNPPENSEPADSHDALVSPAPHEPAPDFPAADPVSGR